MELTKQFEVLIWHAPSPKFTNQCKILPISTSKRPKSIALIAWMAEWWVSKFSTVQSRGQFRPKRPAEYLTHIRENFPQFSTGVPTWDVAHRNSKGPPPVGWVWGLQALQVLQQAKEVSGQAELRFKLCCIFVSFLNCLMSGLGKNHTGCIYLISKVLQHWEAGARDGAPKGPAAAKNDVESTNMGFLK